MTDTATGGTLTGGGMASQLVGDLLIGAVLFVVLRGLRVLLDYLPLSPERRRRARRAYPVVAGSAALLYFLWVAATLFGDRPERLALAVAAVLAATVAASWFAIRDVVAGVVLKAGRVVQVGDRVRIGEVEGRVERMGLRQVVIASGGGEEAVLPYRVVAAGPVSRTPVTDHGAVHVFEVPVGGRSVSELKVRIREAALLSPWATLARRPEVEARGEDRLVVTVFALDADRAADVEGAVRAALQSPALGAGAGGAGAGDVPVPR
ncbi:MAG: mechanosensitive ion channel domain-containing protein [Sandaracinaceae bacterium]